METKSSNGKRAVITGASSGIGFELCRLFAADGYNLVITARRADQLNRLAEDLRSKHGVSVEVILKDLGQPNAAEELWAEISKLGEVDVLVNNAGIGAASPFSESGPGVIAAMLQVNVVALTALTRLALPEMLSRRRGQILNVASLAGLQPGGPGMAVYYATKSYVVSFSRALARELQGSGVTLTALCPGSTHTEFEEKAGADKLRLFRWLPVMDASSVARSGYLGMRRGRAVVIPGLINKLLALGGELPPRRIALEINRILLAG